MNRCRHLSGICFGLPIEWYLNSIWPSIAMSSAIFNHYRPLLPRCLIRKCYRTGMIYRSEAVEMSQNMRGWVKSPPQGVPDRRKHYFQLHFGWYSLSEYRSQDGEKWYVLVRWEPMNELSSHHRPHNGSAKLDLIRCCMLYSQWAQIMRKSHFFGGRSR